MLDDRRLSCECFNVQVKVGDALTVNTAEKRFDVIVQALEGMNKCLNDLQHGIVATHKQI